LKKHRRNLMAMRATSSRLLVHQRTLTSLTCTWGLWLPVLVLVLVRRPHMIPIARVSTIRCNRPRYLPAARIRIENHRNCYSSLHGMGFAFFVYSLVCIAFGLFDYLWISILFIRVLFLYNIVLGSDCRVAMHTTRTTTIHALMYYGKTLHE